MTTYEHVLHGCAPVPLAGYLKALGVFRLVAKQVDPDARGFWRNERFVLRTKLTEDQLVRFFAEIYQPSPIVSPWSGRAGFLEGEDEDSDQQSSRQGAELVRRYETAGPRFARMREAVKVYRSISVITKLDRARADAKPLQEKERKKIALSAIEKSRLKELASQIKSYKASVIATLRSEAPDWAVDWFDACQRIGSDDVKMPLLGSGGNDGSRDFGMNFGSALEELFDFDSGKPRSRTVTLIRESLGFGIAFDLAPGNLGQYEPGGGGENTTSGFLGEQPFNPTDLVFLLEGSVLFSGAATRRLGSSETRLSFPFTVRALTAGSGAAASTDDQNSAEFWAPLWTRAARLGELEAFLAEGRTAVNGSIAKDALEFAVAVSTLGSQRGVPEFQRFALLQREPRNPRKATPLGRVRVRENLHASLVSELDTRGWLSRARTVVRDQNLPPSLGALGRSLDEALFRLAGDGSAGAVQDALITLGALALETGRRPKLRAKRDGLSPPRRLSSAWAEAADDGSHEFLLAVALASLDATDAGGEESAFRLPFRRHLAALVSNRRDDVWDDKTEAKALVVWTGRDLVRDMAEVLERRLTEAQRHAFVDRAGNAQLPLRGRRTAPLAAVTAFIARHTDDERIARLAAGLAWTRTRGGAPFGSGREDAIPFAYAVLKPLFAPDGVGQDEDDRKTVDPLPLVRLLRARRAEDAVALAQRMARGAGLPAPFAGLESLLPADPLRLAAALLFPIHEKAFDHLIARAYPSLTQDEQDSHAA